MSTSNTSVEWTSEAEYALTSLQKHYLALKQENTSLVKQYEAALDQQQGTITKANAEIDRLKRRLSEGMPRCPYARTAWHCSHTEIEMMKEDDNNLNEMMLNEE